MQEVSFTEAIMMIVAIIQARMGSSRLPGKVLKEICGKTLLEHEINRVRQAKRIDGIIVATTNPLDDAIEELCRKIDTTCYRGAENDVLDRYYHAAESVNLGEKDGIVRLTADCPLIDPVIIDEMIELFLRSGADYASNANPPTFPDGLDAEVFTFTALKRCFAEARLLSEREHVTPYIRNNPHLFKQVNLEGKRDLSGLRWTVDEEEDLEVIKTVYENLYCKSCRIFLMEEILAFFGEHPEISGKNLRFKRNEGYEKSLQNDHIKKDCMAESMKTGLGRQKNAAGRVF